MAPKFSYYEESDNNSPSSASFSARQQSASGVYLTNPATYYDMLNRLRDVLGYTGTATLPGAQGGQINRVLPLRHPQYQWLFADSFRPRGTGIDGRRIAPSPGPGSSIIPEFALYANYNCDIAFSPRPYNSWQDKDIQMLSGYYYPPDDTGSGGTPDTAVAIKYATEWMRFTEFILQPLNNFVSAQQGMMRFHTDTGSGANDVQYQDNPRLYLPDCLLKVKWYQVPYRYLTSENSFLRSFIGHVNQFSWGEIQGGVAPNASFGPYNAGSLLYHGAAPTQIYSNVVPDEGLLAYKASENGFVRARLCDLELTFTYTARTSDDAPDMTAVNRNWITAGHNLLPWLTDRKFHYATTFDPNDQAEQTKWVPTFRSVPFSLLFTDPDAQANGVPFITP